MKVHIDTTLNQLLLQEDTGKNKRITIDDKGLKKFTLTVDTKSILIEGTYHLSNLLQELYLAKKEGLEYLTIDFNKIKELPVDRISRMIKDYYWGNLTRTMDKVGIEKLILDTKNNELTTSILKIYVPNSDEIAYKYYKDLEKDHPIETIKLPEDITPEYVLSINKKPGVLALKLEAENNTIKGAPFVVPGGRFNEMYGWDSYFESVGLIIDGKIDLAKSMADNFQYQIQHYGKILNANRTYYLTRTQPPFYSSLVKEVYAKTNDKTWLESHLKTAIKEYFTVWMVKGKRLTETGLNRYFAEGIGMPPETEESHYDAVLKPLAEELNLSIQDYRTKYIKREIQDSDLDNYFLHDRSLRESGHDTTYRLEDICASLNTVQLNSLLYKYEIDFADIIKAEFNDTFKYDNQIFNSEYWLQKAATRKDRINSFLWKENEGLYFDFNFVEEKHTSFIAATIFAPLWAGLCTKEQADKLVKKGLNLLLNKGGITGTTKESVGIINGDNPERQWDYPYGWAPHQMMLWIGLKNYGYINELQECAYKWLYMLTINAVNYNGTISEKYNVVEATHKVYAEYGNVGTDFEYVPDGGFGWMNATYKLGVSLLKQEYIDALNILTEPDLLFQKNK